MPPQPHELLTACCPCPWTPLLPTLLSTLALSPQPFLVNSSSSSTLPSQLCCSFLAPFSSFLFSVPLFSCSFQRRSLHLPPHTRACLTPSYLTSLIGCQTSLLLELFFFSLCSQPLTVPDLLLKPGRVYICPRSPELSRLPRDTWEEKWGRAEVGKCQLWLTHFSQGWLCSTEQ